MYAFFGDCTIFLESEKFTTEKEGHCLRFFALQSVSLDALGIALDNMSESFQTKWQRFANYCKMKQKELLTTSPSFVEGFRCYYNIRNVSKYH